MSQTAFSTKVRTHSILSRAEVEARLPLLNRIAEDVARTWRDVLDVRSKLDRVDRGSEEGSSEALREELSIKVDRVNRYIEEIEALGARLQEYRRGVLNYPIEVSGRLVLACWLPNESRVSHWHEMHEGVEVRRPF